MVEEKYGLLRFFDYLERASGGKGNGFSLVKDGKHIYTRKGVNLSNEAIIKLMSIYNDFDYVLYHTRIASCGVVSDANCHPFRQGNVMLAMNGTETKFTGIADILGITDTEAVLKTIVRFQLPLKKTLTQLTGTYVGFINGRAFAIANQSGYKNLEIAQGENGALVMASQLPDVFERYEADKLPFVYAEGEDMPKLIKMRTYTKTWGGVQDGGKSEYASYTGYEYYEDRYVDRRYNHGTKKAEVKSEKKEEKKVIVLPEGKDDKKTEKLVKELEKQLKKEESLPFTPDSIDVQ
jgi:predicted glutamine amidotransferase